MLPGQALRARVRFGMRQLSLKILVRLKHLEFGLLIFITFYFREQRWELLVASEMHLQHQYGAKIRHWAGRSDDDHFLTPIESPGGRHCDVSRGKWSRAFMMDCPRRTVTLSRAQRR